ncbi:MAG TPA: fibronectin type III domain-containing protein [Vicinamibacterales bacterium]|nr:fibronectin type III domain-containing protein [Vicinamibacterales bacterium]
MIGQYLPLVALFLALTAVGAGGAQPPARAALLVNEPPPPRAADAAPAAIGRPGDLRARLARVVPGALGSAALRLDLFPDVSLDADLTRRGRSEQGWTTWSGQVAGDPRSSVTLVGAGRLLQGSVRHGRRAFSIEPLDDDGLHVIREIDLTALGQELPPLVAPTGLLPLYGAAASQPPDDGGTIDLLVVYTAGARMAAGGSEAAVQARIALGVVETNEAYASSGVVQRLRLVGAELVGYRESGDIAFDLQQLTGAGGGELDLVRARRNAVGADLVQLIVGPVSGNACGVAWLMQSPSAAFAPLGFSVTAYGCISPNYTFGHELAHNMGSAHAPEDPNATPAFPFSYGYKHPGALFRTIMAYDCPAGCPRVLHFSSPLVSYDGAPTGTPGLQDNARSLDNTRLAVANFRESRDPATVLAAPENFAVTTTGATAVFSWTPPLTGEVSRYVVEAGMSPGLADVATFVNAAPATSLVVPAVPPGTYFVRVRAENGDGPGAPSSSMSLIMTDRGRCVALSGPPLLGVPVVAGRSVTLAWEAPTVGGAAESYVIGAGASPEALDTAVIRTGSADRAITLDAGDGLYFVRVAGRNPCGIGAPSNEVTVAVGPAIPGPPSGLAAVVQPGGLVTLSWSAASAGGTASGYVVEAGSASGLADIAVLDGHGVATSFAAQAQPRTYFVRVRATNAKGVSAPSNELAVVVP